MGIIKSTIVTERALRTLFMVAFKAGEDPKDVMDMIMETKSTGPSEKYGWLGQVAEMIVFKDKRVIKGLNDFDYTIPNIPYESTLGVDQDELDDDQYGQIKIRINDLAKKARSFPRKLYFDALIAGTVKLSYDGQAFFSASHEEGASGVQSNLLTHTYSSTLPSLAELTAAFDECVDALLSFKDDQGGLLNDGADLKLKVVCSVALRSLFRKLFNAQIISNDTNVNVNDAALVVSARLSGAPFYVSVIGEPIRPFIWQKRKDITFGSQVEGSERGFMNKEFAYGIDARYGFSYGLWQRMVRMAKT